MKRRAPIWVSTLFVMLVVSVPVNAQDCYESSILSPSPFMGNNGEIFKLADGSLWEVKYEYEYLYEYHPSVIICPKSSKLIIKDKSLSVELVSSGATEGSGAAESGQKETVIESRIVSEFEGLSAGNIYKLANGQVWEQVEAWIWVWVWVNPTVMIYPAAGGYKMKVENIEHPVFVRRVK